MKEFIIGELSSVDQPAQQHARTTIMKRAEPRETEDMTISNYATFDEAIAAVAKATGAPRHAAMSEAARRFPSLVENYNDEGMAIAKGARAEPRAITEAETVFTERVETVQKRDRCGRAVAMQRARAEYPSDFAAYRQI